MCKEITVWATNDDGSPHPDAPEFIYFSDFEGEFPICTCWIGDTEGKGAQLRHLFAERCLQPLFRKISCGKIVIELQ